jgi:four helix bundle protein
MTLKFEDLRVLRTAEAIADDVWQEVIQWDAFARDVVGGQLARATDSIGANIAEAFGRFHYGEKLQFLYYARGSLFESKYWLNRAAARQLMPAQSVQEYASQLSETAHQINAFANTIRKNRSSKKKSTTLKEPSPDYITDGEDTKPPIFDETELTWIETYSGPVPKSFFDNPHQQNT